MRPDNEAELADIVRGANGPLVFRGGGTRTVGTSAGEVVETGGLSGITLYEPGALTLVVRAGTPVAMIEAALAAEGQRLAFEVPDMRALLGTAGQSTIGGVVAMNASGPRRVQAGAARDFCLGVRFVDGRGAVVKNGGRVMKNVTGLDLVKLMAGSRGTLGCLTEVSLKVLPIPEAQATLVARGLSTGAAVAAMARALGSPFEVTGAAHLTEAGETRLRIEGMAQSVAYRLGRLRSLLGPGWDEAPDQWNEVRDVTPFADRPGTVWRLHLKPTDAAQVLARVRSVHPDIPAVFDWGGGLVWLLVPPAAAAAVRAAVTSGHATLWRGAPGVNDVPPMPPEAPALAALTAGVRRQFDPKGLFAPHAA